VEHEPVKYMGSKRAMLGNGLGELIDSELCGHDYQRFVDLFAGSAAVSWHVAQLYPIEVLANDLQLYSCVLAKSLLGRTESLNSESVWRDWLAAAAPLIDEAQPPEVTRLSLKSVNTVRAWAELFPEHTLVHAYGGHYFSPLQATWIEALRSVLPTGSGRTVCLSALIVAASRAAAAPGHTAQPFQPTASALQFIEESWRRDIPTLVKETLDELCNQHALELGSATQLDANSLASTLRPSDLVFLDPPYSGVHYSRFYHVLESIAHGSAGIVSGVGRYPAPTKRPKSKYSNKGTALTAVDELLKCLAMRQVTALFTFPDHECSNGLSGREVINTAEAYFNVQIKSVKSTFSTLGGGYSANPSRKARHTASELILVLRTK
jgi:adenine-specific DNA-methyltransferase